MGCHTWFYAKIEPQPTYEEVKQNVINHLEEKIDFYNEVVNGNLDSEFLEVYPELTPEFGLKYKSIYERKLQFVKKDLCKKAVYNNYRLSEDVLIINVNGTLYQDIDEYHDLFRKYKYPEDMLFSLKETLEYIEKYKDEIIIYEDTYSMLEEFWEEYPNGMIRFG